MADAEKDVPQPGTLAYAQMVAEQHGDLEDAAIEDGMDAPQAHPFSPEEARLMRLFIALRLDRGGPDA